MSRLLLLVAALLSNGITPAVAQSPTSDGRSNERAGGPFGLGLAVGAPAGLTGKFWLGDWSALQFTSGANLGQVNSWTASADYVIAFRPFAVEDNAYAIPLHAGGGFNVDVLSIGAAGDGTGAKVLMGPRGVFGASLLVPNLPIDFHAEIAPTLYFVEYFGWSVDGQIGFRYYF